MRNTFFRWTLVSGLLILPFAIHWLYQKATELPKHVRMATGPEGGRYRVLTESLAEHLSANYNIHVKPVSTKGSAENLELLRHGHVDFALFMAAPKAADPRESDVAFVANVYSELVHLFVRKNMGIQSIDDLKSKRIAVGIPGTGDHTMAHVVLKHLGLAKEEIEIKTLDYAQIKTMLIDESLDAAIITTGNQAPILQQIAESDTCELFEIPFTKSLASKYLLVSESEIPAGRYQTGVSQIPPIDLNTVAVKAQMLTSKGVSANLVKTVTATILSAEFQEQNGLIELSEKGRQFARQQPQFSVHAGVQKFYDPEIRPLLNPDFVDATEGIRSFIVSLMIAAFLGFRWFKEQKNRMQGHKLDHYIRAILDLEKRQMKFDSDSDANDIDDLQLQLAKITELRREALEDFSAHDLKEDRAVDCFLEMCHALSRKIDAKLSRQRIDKQFNEMKNS